VFRLSGILDERIRREVRGKVINSRIDGRATIMEGAKIINSTIRGPCMIGRNCVIQDSYVGPYTSVGDSSRIIRSSVEYSVILENVMINGVDRLEESLVGYNAKLIKESGRSVIKLHVGDYSEVVL